MGKGPEVHKGGMGKKKNIPDRQVLPLAVPRITITNPLNGGAGSIIISPQTEIHVVSSTAEAFRLITQVMAEESKKTSPNPTRERKNRKPKTDKAADAKTTVPAVKVDKENKPIPVSQIIDIPFGGKVGILSNMQASEIIPQLFARSEDKLNWDRLIDDNQRLTLRWKTDRSAYPRLLFIRDLIPDQEGMKSAREMNIRGVYFNGENVVFIINGEQKALHDGKEIPLGINAVIDKNGYVSIPGMPTTFEGEPLHLFLSNLALYLKTRKIETLGESVVFDGEFKQEVRSTAKSRHLDPEPQGERDIVISIANGNKPSRLVAVGELKKK